MTGMKENQSTKGTLRRRRTNKQVQADILSAVGRILQEKDFTHITLMDIAREAKTDPNVVLRRSDLWNRFSTVTSARLIIGCTICSATKP